MFEPIVSDFSRNGDLRSNVRFEFVGEVSGVNIRRYASLSKEPGKEGEPDSETFTLEISDRYGFSCSFFRHGMTQEKAYLFAAKIPYSTTLLISGRVAIRKGRTYFNADKIFYPDETPVFLWNISEVKDETGGEEGETE